MTTPAAQDLLERWRTEKDFTVRDSILDELIENGVFPGKEQEGYELESGLYPDINNPDFLPRLMSKREFQESKQKSIKESLEEGKGCRSTEDFEITPVQRFVSRLLSPRTPYNSALLYHGVGVGKTCAAVTVCESYLKEFPGRKVYIVAPPNIQDGFKRTIFDREALVMPKGGESAHHRGCTGDTYLALTGSFKETKRDVIENRIAKAIKNRYSFFGYTSFYNKIINVLSEINSHATDEQKQNEKVRLLREEFSNRVIVVDEVHNLRDNPNEGDEEIIDDTTPSDSAESKAGKKLTPYFREVLEFSEGITLVLMTATPMYNSYVEIVFLLNLLLTNDKYQLLRPGDIFDTHRGGFVPGGDKILGKVASQYISFMRGENPLTFPIRLEPKADNRITVWPKKSPKGESINTIELGNCVKLPILTTRFSQEVENLYKEQSENIVTQGLGITNMDILVQAGNWIFPGTSDDDFLDRIRQQGFDNTFSKERRGNLIYYKNNEGDASWLLEKNLPSSSGKCAEVLKRVNKCRGVAFVYSRFVASGALTIALALEANGYTCWNRDIGFLAEGNQNPDGRQCALCDKKERVHGGSVHHSFKPAKYILLTGSEELSPNNAKAIDAVRSSGNKNGEEIKVVLGSQIAGEGLDLRYIREVLVFDSWYHLNKLEQVVGRGIRNCSHAALDPKKRNCTLTLLVNSYATDPNTETIDMYSYRLALKKAILVGNVTRVLKEYAIDCSLNREAILIKNLDPIPVIIDSQGYERFNQPINDVPLTPMCDWLQTCEYDCKAGDGSLMKMNISLEEQDSSTYDEYTARYRIAHLRLYLQDRIVKGTPFVTFDKIERDFSTIPRPLLGALLDEIVDNRDMPITTPTGNGYIVYRNGYYLFQPDKIQDTRIPIALRIANIPIPRDRFEPRVEEVVEVVRENVADEDSEELWEESIKLSDSIRNGTLENISNNFKTELEKITEGTGLMKGQEERIYIIKILYESIKHISEVREIFAKIVLEYIWDEFLTLGTKRELLKSGTDIVKRVAAESYAEFEGQSYIRLLNGNTNTMEYICEGAPCSKAIIEVIEREIGRDPLLKNQINNKHTGFKYGFINFNPKKKVLVFKQGEPPMPNGKLTRGSECAINSYTEKQREIIGKLEQEIKKSNKHVFNVIENHLIKNSVRICTVSNFTLRYMDALRIQGKRWFYRAIESKLHNHPLR